MIRASLFPQRIQKSTRCWATSLLGQTLFDKRRLGLPQCTGVKEKGHIDLDDKDAWRSTGIDGVPYLRVTVRVAI